MLETVRAHCDVEEIGAKRKLCHVTCYKGRPPLYEHLAGALEHPNTKINGEEIHSRRWWLTSKRQQSPGARARIEHPVRSNRKEPGIAQLLEKITVRASVTGGACKGVPEPALALEKCSYFVSVSAACAVNWHIQMTGPMTACITIMSRHSPPLISGKPCSRPDRLSQRIRLNTSP